MTTNGAMVFCLLILHVGSLAPPCFWAGRCHPFCKRDEAPDLDATLGATFLRSRGVL